MIKRVTKDFETRAWIELKKVGAYEYSLHPLTQPTCLAFKILGNPKIYFLDFEMINRQWKDLPESFRTLWARLIKEGYEFSAYNSFFERCIYDNILVRRYGWPGVDPKKRRCTAAKAAACALPRNLEGAGESLRLTIQKDKRGYNAMRATCKPTRVYRAWEAAREKVRIADSGAGPRVTEGTRKKAAAPEPPMFLTPKTAPGVFETLYTYCRFDVRSEEELDTRLPDLIPAEQEVWFLNQELNWDGIRVDIPTIRKITGILNSESKKKLTELDQLTVGLVTKAGARASVLEFLEREGVELPNLQKNTVEDALKGFFLTETARELLEIRKALSYASTKKYKSFLDRAGKDDRIRDLVLYHGASTGRDAGSGLNIYNFPRGLIPVDPDRPYAAVENVVSESLEMLQLLYGDNLPLVFSAILRNMIIPSDGCDLFVGDFTGIEVIVLWWLADHEAGLQIFRDGRDPYRDQAAANLNVAYEEIAKDGNDRQLGKAQTLGCGFRMSWKRFQETAWTMYRLKLTSRQSVDAVKSYRTKNRPVVDLWDAYEDAAVAAVESPGAPIKAGKCIFQELRGFLWVTLPSGRKLAYFEPEITYRSVTYVSLEKDPKTGEDIEVQKTSNPRKTIQFRGLDKSKKRLQTEFSHGGILTENIVQATARDLLMPALLRLKAASYKPLLSVYDEAVCERLASQGSVTEFLELLCRLPDWAKGMPVTAKGWTEKRYRK